MNPPTQEFAERFVELCYEEDSLSGLPAPKNQEEFMGRAQFATKIITAFLRHQRPDLSKKEVLGWLDELARASAPMAVELAVENGFLASTDHHSNN